MSINKRDSEDVPYIPKALIDWLTNLTVEYMILEAINERVIFISLANNYIKIKFIRISMLRVAKI